MSKGGTFHNNQAVRIRDAARKKRLATDKASRNRNYCPKCSFSSLDETEYKVHYKKEHTS